jgi:hypothetical protein
LLPEQDPNSYVDHGAARLTEGAEHQRQSQSEQHVHDDQPGPRAEQRWIGLLTAHNADAHKGHD